MRSLLFALLFASLTTSQVLAQAKPSATKSPATLDRTAKKEVAAMEQQLGVAAEKHDTAALEKMIADLYSDAYEGGEVAKSKAGAIARCQAGLQSFLKIGKDERFSGTRDAVTVEGEAKLMPDEVDDVTPEKWVHVRRLWEKKDGAWRLMSQRRREKEEKE